MQCVGQPNVLFLYFKLMLLELYIPQADSCLFQDLNLKSKFSEV